MFGTKELYKETNMLQVKQISELLTLNFVYKQRNKMLPAVFDNYYTAHKEIKTTNITTRQNEKLYIKSKSKTENTKFNIKISGVITWNKLPQKLKNSKWSTFKRNCKKYLLNKQNNTNNQIK